MISVPKFTPSRVIKRHRQTTRSKDRNAHTAVHLRDLCALSGACAVVFQPCPHAYHPKPLKPAQWDKIAFPPFSFPELRSSWPAPRIESSGRFQSVLVTDWSDGNTIKMITGRKRKRLAEGILFSVCRTCNRYIISNNYPLDLFGEKAIRKESYGIEKSFMV